MIEHHLDIYYTGGLDRQFDRALLALCEKHGWKWRGQGMSFVDGKVKVKAGTRDIGFVKPRKD